MSIVRFAVALDPVPYLSPIETPVWAQIIGSLLQNAFSSDWLGLVRRQPSVYHVYIDASGVVAEPFDRHNCYPDLHSLDDFGPQGYPLSDPRSAPLAIGATTRIPWVHN